MKFINEMKLFEALCNFKHIFMYILVLDVQQCEGP